MSKKNAATKPPLTDHLAVTGSTIATLADVLYDSTTGLSWSTVPNPKQVTDIVNLAELLSNKTDELRKYLRQAQEWNAPKPKKAAR